MLPRSIIEAFDAHLLARGLRFEAVIVGGSALGLLESAPQLPIAEVARRASCSFATAWQTAQDFRLLHGNGR